MSKPNRTRIRTHGNPVPQRPRGAKPNVFAVTHAAHRTKLGGRDGFDYPVVQEGQTTKFVVFRDPSLGSDGASCADGVLATCENDYTQAVAWFGIAAPQLPINIIIAALDPSGQGGRGAYHYGCSATDLYCDLKNVPSLDIDFTRMLLVAELVEVFEAAQNLGFHWGESAFVIRRALIPNAPWSSVSVDPPMKRAKRLGSVSEFLRSA